MIRIKPWSSAAVALALVAVVAALRAVASVPKLRWYGRLHKPNLYLPDAWHGIVWTLLYALMAYAVWCILTLPRGMIGRGAALRAFLALLALQIGWSFAFYQQKSPLFGLAEIALQDLVLLLTLALFARLELGAARALGPLALWTAYATYVNFEIWRLN